MIATRTDAVTARVLPMTFRDRGEGGFRRVADRLRARRREEIYEDIATPTCLCPCRRAGDAEHRARRTGVQTEVPGGEVLRHRESRGERLPDSELVVCRHIASRQPGRRLDLLARRHLREGRRRQHPAEGVSTSSGQASADDRKSVVGTYDVVYVGMAAAGRRGGLRGRLMSHARSKRRGKKWSHFSAFVVWDNIRDEE